MLLGAHGCLGLVLAFIGIRTLALSVNPIIQVVALSDLVDGTEMLAVGLPAVVTVLQIAAGCAFVFGARVAGWVCLGAYVLGAAGVVVWTTIILEVDEPSMIAGVAVETFGTPLVAIVAMLVGRPAGSTPRAEVGLMLVVVGMSSALGIAIRSVETLYVMTMPHTHASIGAVAGELLSTGIFLTIAILQARAGFALRRGDPRADRALGAYVIAAMAGELLYLVLNAAFLVVAEGSMVKMLLAIRAVGALDGIGLALLAWTIARRDRAPLAMEILPMSPIWYALILLPFLAARPFISVDIPHGDMPALPIVLTAALVAQAVVMSLAVAATLSGRLSAVGLWVIATVLGLVTMGTFVVLSYIEIELQRAYYGPLLTLVVIAAVIAWLHRTTASRVPRAVVRR